MKKLFILLNVSTILSLQTLYASDLVNRLRRQSIESNLERYHNSKFKELFELAKYSLKNKHRVESASAHEVKLSISILKNHLKRGASLNLLDKVEEFGVYEGLYLPLLFKLEETITKKDFWNSNTLTAAIGEIDPTLGEKFSDFYGLAGNEHDLLRAKGIDGGGFTPHEWKQNHIKFLRMPGKSPIFGSVYAKGSTKNQCLKGCSEGSSAGTAIGAAIGAVLGVPGTATGATAGAIGGCIGGCIAEVNNGKKCKAGEPNCDKSGSENYGGHRPGPFIGPYIPRPKPNQPHIPLPAYDPADPRFGHI